MGANGTTASGACLDVLAVQRAAIFGKAWPRRALDERAATGESTQTARPPLNGHGRGVVIAKRERGKRELDVRSGVRHHLNLTFMRKLLPKQKSRWRTPALEGQSAALLDA